MFMDGQDYLNQISAENRPVKKSKSGIFSSKIFMAIMIGVIALVFIIIVGSIIGNGKSSEKELSYALKLHIDNTSKVISEYQPEVKSSDLRSHSASLNGVLSNTTRELTDYLTSKYDFKEKDVPQKLVDEAQLEMDGLEADLFEAKINGILDRIYAHKMAYEISMLMSEENKLLNSTGDEAFQNILSTSYSSLENLYSKFNDFSEAS